MRLLASSLSIIEPSSLVPQICTWENEFKAIMPNSKIKKYFIVIIFDFDLSIIISLISSNILKYKQFKASPGSG